MSSSNSTPVVAPSVIPINAASLTRLAAGLLAGYLAKLGFDGNQASLIASGVIALVIGGWSIYKNHQASAALATAMATPAVKVVTPAGLPVPPAPKT